MISIAFCGSSEAYAGIYLKSTRQRAGSATYMPHCQQKHAYEGNTHKIRRNLKTKYNDNKKTWGHVSTFLPSSHNSSSHPPLCFPFPFLLSLEVGPLKPAAGSVWTL